MTARVLMIAERLPPAIGGVEQHIAGLAGELAKRGYQLSFVAPAHVSGLPSSEPLQQGMVWRIPHHPASRGRYGQAWRWWYQHRSLLQQADLIHCHDVYALLHWLGPMRWLVPRTPVYLTYHGYEMAYPIPHRAWWYRWASRYLVQDSLAIGHFIAQWFPVRPRFTTYGAVTLPEHPTPLPDEPRALFVGRLAEDTGLELYLRGVGLWQRQTGRVLPVTVCGDGPLRPQLTQIAQDENIQADFLGWVDDPTPHWQRATIALVSGYLSMLTAMAYQRPVLSVYHTPIKESYLRLIPGSAKIIRIASSIGQISRILQEWDERRPDSQIAAAYFFACHHSWANLAALYEQLWGRGEHGLARGVFHLASLAC